MSSIRLLHLADLHIGMENYGRMDPATGLNGRVMDFLRRLSDVVEYAFNVRRRPLRVIGIKVPCGSRYNFSDQLIKHIE